MVSYVHALTYRLLLQNEETVVIFFSRYIITVYWFINPAFVLC